MSCPKCARPRGDGPECPHCGIVYSKFKPPAPQPQAAPAAPQVGSRKTARRNVAIALVAVVASTAVILRLRTRTTPASEPSAVVVAPAGVAPRPAPALTVSDTGPQNEPNMPGAPAVAHEQPARAPDPASCSIFSADVASSPPPPSISASWFEGASGFRRASDEQASSRAPLLLYFYVEWCPHCRRFMAEVLPSAEARELYERVLKVKVNAEGNTEDRELARRYSVTSYPTFLMIPAPGQAPVRVSA